MPLDLPDRMCCFQPHSLKDVAAHGLDLPQVTWIVQYNPPITAVEYVLVGHTAQIGARGSSLLFLTPSKTTFVDVLANHIIRPPRKLTMKEPGSNLMHSEYVSGIEGESKSKKMRKKKIKKRNLLLHENEVIETIRDAVFSQEVLRSEPSRLDGFSGLNSGVFTQSVTFLPVTTHYRSAALSEYLLNAKKSVQMVK
ncbi:probable ATP-dependent RNA helicase DDX31 isoform X1 [Myxocyprinus asiaticus]|uniref:probable ATP-dependent RNA helicase DDX31 isoform X1 n=1 Tax=Myxocyprinus asiaticus TaxID=70543 RepID=UPI0022231A73|nr:probable ATP-dependent RNA helicase DDX31 isoform X1 [Myxocyprinus asiaticus]XP_051539546.1 probable ATP-dependent RNA helicase DDX31 isoform X1 [Myxocyprinus asiaticus]XP_051539552.1 probable ATP-dependent RNA helicase DDX31 isoform X1 [Myxocyprinus asiaticus]